MSVTEQILLFVGGPAVLVACVLWLSRNLIVTRLKNSVANEFNTKLESLKSDLRGKEAEIAAVREMAASLAMGRGQAIESRRLQAIDDIWEGFLNVKKRGYPVHTVQAMNLDAVSARIESEPKLQEFFAMIFPGDLGTVEPWGVNKASQARPWISPLAWAYFSAYMSMVGYCEAWVHTAAIGLEPEKFVTRNEVNKLLALAIPEVEFEVEKDNSNLFVSAGDLLEIKMVMELRREIRGEDLDEEAIERAKKIAEAANSLDSRIAVEKAEQKIAKINANE